MYLPKIKYFPSPAFILVHKSTNAILALNTFLCNAANIRK